MTQPAVDLLAPSTLTTQYESSRPRVPAVHPQHSAHPPMTFTCVLPCACWQVSTLDDGELELGELPGVGGASARRWKKRRASYSLSFPFDSSHVGMSSLRDGWRSRCLSTVARTCRPASFTPSCGSSMSTTSRDSSMLHLERLLEGRLELLQH